jgi:hypothetical protein
VGRSAEPSDYSLRHVIAHLCRADDVTRLENLMLDFKFWCAAAP